MRSIVFFAAGMAIAFLLASVMAYVLGAEGIERMLIFIAFGALGGLLAAEAEYRYDERHS